MNVLIISRGIPTKENPLNGIFEMDQARALTAAGHRVTFFVLDLRSIRRKRSFGTFQREIEGIRVFVYSFPVGAVPPALLVKFGRHGLKKLYKKAYGPGEYPDIVHAHFTEMGCMAAGLAKREKLHFVITEHSSIMAEDTVPENLLKVARQGYEAADRVIAVSSGLSERILQHTGAASVVVPNVVDPGVFSKVRRKSHEGFTFLTVANLIPRKRVELLLDAFSLIHEELPDTKLEIVGDGSEKERLVSKAEEAGLGDAVLFDGRIPREQIAERMAYANCFALATERETFGVVYAEAMMAGLPVIATICGGPEDFVTEETGLLGRYDTPEELASAMKRMYDNCSSYDPERIRNYAVERFSPKRIAEELTQVYEVVLS